MMYAGNNQTLVTNENWSLKIGVSDKLDFKCANNNCILNTNNNWIKKMSASNNWTLGYTTNKCVLKMMSVTTRL